MNKQKQAFTLVELIVVITILAILGTIAFISLQGYSKDARDSIRISDISNIKTSLELFHLNSGKYPLPDDNQIVNYGTETLWYQGDFGTTVISSLSRSMSVVPTDPLTDKKYVFSVANNKNEFELLSLLEGDSLALNNINQTNAASLDVTPKIDGTYNRVFIKTANYVVPVPSIITSETLLSTMTLDSSNISSQVINGGENIPEQGNVISNTGALTGLVLSVYTGSIVIDDSNTTKETVIQKIKNAYVGSVLASNDIYNYILSTSGELDNVNLVNSLIFNDNTREVDFDPGWRLVDTNCNLPDVKIGTQTWAGCNSTIGNGVEWGKQLNGSDGTVHGTIGCYDYDGISISTCTIGSANMASNTVANTWFSGTNLDGDSELAGIWGKHYTWANALGTYVDTNLNSIIEADEQGDDGACGVGYHVPTDSEWAILENYLNGSTCRTGTGWECPGLGWRFHSSKDETNNIVEALKLPLTGRHETDGSSFYYRGANTYIRSATESGSNAYSRYFGYDTGANNWLTNKNYGFAVRCIKD